MLSAFFPLLLMPPVNLQEPPCSPASSSRLAISSHAKQTWRTSETDPAPTPILSSLPSWAFELTLGIGIISMGRLDPSFTLGSRPEYFYSTNPCRPRPQGLQG
jgi:hypothetical protein